MSPPGAPERPAAAEPSFARQFGRAVLTVIVFALLVPLIGGLLTVLALALMGEAPATPSEAAILGVVLLFFWGAYPVGLVPAAGLGAAVAVLDLVFPRATSGTVSLLVGIAVIVGYVFYEGEQTGGSRAFTILFAATAAIGTAAAWWLVGPRRRRTGVAA